MESVMELESGTESVPMGLTLEVMRDRCPADPLSGVDVHVVVTLRESTITYGNVRSFMDILKLPDSYVTRPLDIDTSDDDTVYLHGRCPCPDEDTDILAGVIALKAVGVPVRTFEGTMEASLVALNRFWNGEIYEYVICDEDGDIVESLSDITSREEAQKLGEDALARLRGSLRKLVCSSCGSTLDSWSIS